MPYLKFVTTPSPDGALVAARLFSGETYEQREYSGTITLPSEYWERLLDCLVYGAARMGLDDDKLYVFFGPDEIS